MAILKHADAINTLLGLSRDARESDAYLQGRYRQLTGRVREAPDLRLDLATRALRVTLVRGREASASAEALNAAPLKNK